MSWTRAFAAGPGTARIPGPRRKQSTRPMRVPAVLIRPSRSTSGNAQTAQIVQPQNLRLGLITVPQAHIAIDGDRVFPISMETMIATVRVRAGITTGLQDEATKEGETIGTDRGIDIWRMAD